MNRGFAFTAVFLTILLLSGSALSQMWNYSPLTKAEIGKPFPMKRIEPNLEGNPSLLTFPAGLPEIHVVLERHDDSFSIVSAFGKDADHRDWRMELTELGGCHFPSDFYVADLDGNGINDLVMVIPTCGNGLAPQVHFLALLFDEKGRPVPFEADGYFESLPNGIDALVDMNHDGRAVLIYMNFNDGYWITNIYRSQNAHWHRVQGQFAKREYPLFTRFTKRPNRKAVAPKSGTHPFAPDLSNDTPLLEGHLASFRIPESLGSDVELMAVNSEGANIQCTPAYWYGSVRVVLDRQNGRQIVDLSCENKKNASPILEEIISRNLKVSFYGKRYSDKCSPEIVWASEDK
ncbi:MAG: hypothetical protein ACLP3B_13765 [Syntrophobacteraceae bacterium]